MTTKIKYLQKPFYDSAYINKYTIEYVIESEVKTYEKPYFMTVLSKPLIFADPNFLSGSSLGYAKKTTRDDFENNGRFMFKRLDSAIWGSGNASRRQKNPENLYDRSL